jgi:putative flippase GtrA
LQLRLYGDSSGRERVLKRQLFRFVLVGLAATITTYATLIIGVELFDVAAVTASIVGYALGVLVNYWLNYRYTFGSSKKHTFVLPRFLMVTAVGMMLNAFIMYAGIHWFQLNYLLAQLFAVMIVMTWSFSANRLWAFAD